VLWGKLESVSGSLLNNLYNSQLFLSKNVALTNNTGLIIPVANVNIGVDLRIVVLGHVVPERELYLFKRDTYYSLIHCSIYKAIESS